MLNKKLLGFLSVVAVTFVITGCSKEKMEESKQTTEDSASSMSDTVSESAKKTGDAASSAADTAGDMASDASEKTHSMASDAAKSTSNAMDSAGDMADRAGDNIEFGNSMVFFCRWSSKRMPMTFFSDNMNQYRPMRARITKIFQNRQQMRHIMSVNWSNMGKAKLAENRICAH